MTKTVVIWDECDSEIKYFVLEGDYSHLNRKYVNSQDTTEVEEAELVGLVYDEKGNAKVPFTLEFPTEEVIYGASVISCGFLP